MNPGDIVRIGGSGEHEGRYGIVREVRQGGGACVVEFEDDRKEQEFPPDDVQFVRRGGFRGNPR